MPRGFARMLALSRDFGHLTPAITVSGRAVYCAAVRRWPSRQVRQKSIKQQKIFHKRSSEDIFIPD